MTIPVLHKTSSRKAIKIIDVLMVFGMLLHVANSLSFVLAVAGRTWILWEAKRLLLLPPLPLKSSNSMVPLPFDSRVSQIWFKKVA